MAHRDGLFVRLAGVEQEHARPVRRNVEFERDSRPGRVATSTLILIGAIVALPFVVTGYLAFAVLILLPVVGVRALFAAHAGGGAEPAIVTRSVSR
jgi:hypothetical protein